MKKKNKWMVLCLMTMVCCTACSKDTQKEVNDNLIQNTIKPEENESHNTEVQQENNQEPQVETKTVTVYGYDDQGVMLPREVTVKGDIPETLVSELVKENVIPEGVEVLNITVNEVEKKMEIDVNTEFGNYIRRMGTFGESATIECFVRTFAGVYNCKEVKITEQGAVLESGHAIYDGYLSYE